MREGFSILKTAITSIRRGSSRVVIDLADDPQSNYSFSIIIRKEEKMAESDNYFDDDDFDFDDEDDFDEIDGDEELEDFIDGDELDDEDEFDDFDDGGLDLYGAVGADGLDVPDLPDPVKDLINRGAADAIEDIRDAISDHAECAESRRRMLSIETMFETMERESIPGLSRSLLSTGRRHCPSFGTGMRHRYVSNVGGRS